VCRALWPKIKGTNLPFCFLNKHKTISPLISSVYPKSDWKEIAKQLEFFITSKTVFLIIGDHSEVLRFDERTSYTNNIRKWDMLQLLRGIQVLFGLRLAKER
jgi:hypothetical protein